MSVIVSLRRLKQEDREHKGLEAVPTKQEDFASSS